MTLHLLGESVRDMGMLEPTSGSRGSWVKLMDPVPVSFSFFPPQKTFFYFFFFLDQLGFSYPVYLLFLISG
jgi:hypothetical protein